MIYVTMTLPFESSLMNVLEITNAVTTELISVCLIILTVQTVELNIRKIIGWSIVALVLVNIVLNIAVIVIQTMRNICMKIQKCRKKGKGIAVA